MMISAEKIKADSLGFRTHIDMLKAEYSSLAFDFIEGAVSGSFIGDAAADLIIQKVCAFIFYEYVSGDTK